MCSKPGSRDVLLLGMGGSSLGPEVFAETFGAKPGFPSCMCSIRPTRRRSGASKARSTSRARCSSCRANPAARSSRTSSSSISSSARRRRSAPPRRPSISSRSPIPARRSKRSRATRAFRARLPRRAEHRRALFGAVEFRHGAGRGDGRRRRAPFSKAPPRWCAPARRARRRSRIPGVILGAILGVCQRHGRDKVDDHRLAGHRRFRRLARTAARRIDRQARQGDRARSTPSRSGRRRSTAMIGCSPICGWPPTQDAEQERAVAALEARRSSGGADRRLRRDAARPGILPLGDGDRGRRLDHRHQPVRPARCRGQQGQDPRADHRLREDRHAAAGEAVLRPRPAFSAVRRPEERSRAGAEGDEPDRGV